MLEEVANSVCVGIILGTYVPQVHRPFLLHTTVDCPGSLPLEPIHRNPLLPNDTRLSSAKEELSGVLQAKLDGTDSAVIIAIHGGQTILEWTHGRIRSNVSAKEDGRKVDADTIWRVASITKVFTVLEALVQEQKGSLSLDDDVRRYIEQFTLFENATDRVPLRALGSHLSGLGRDGTLISAIE
jgi:CubicO group peptidase (beta-lactamase class C family)